MRVLKIAVILSTVVGAAACGSDAKPAADQQKQQLTWLDSLMTAPAQPAAAATPVELNQALAPDSAAPQALAAVAETKAPAKTTTHHASSSTRHRSTRRSSSGGSSSGSYGSYEPARQPRVVTVKHTRRDAAIGAGVGAVAGAVAGGGRHRVRGAIVGGVLGGVAGAVIGNNVDKSRQVQY